MLLLSWAMMYKMRTSAGFLAVWYHRNKIINVSRQNNMTMLVNSGTITGQAYSQIKQIEAEHKFQIWKKF